MGGTLSAGRRVGTEMGLASDGEGQVLHAVGLLKHGAELLLEANGGQALTEHLEIDLEVLIVEELGVVEARTDDALIAVDHGGVGLGVAVGDNDERTGQIAFRVICREVTLVGQHGLADDLGRDVQELLVEVAHENRRPLTEIDDLVEHLRRSINAHAELGFDLGDTLADDLLATLGGQDMGGLENILVGISAGDEVLTGGKHAMTARGVAAHNVGKGDRDDLLTEEAADPTDRAHEGGMLAAPTLATVVRPLDGRDEALAHTRQDGKRGLRGGVLLSEDVLGAIGVLATDQFASGETVFAGKALGGLGGIALGVEGDLGRGTTQDGVDLLRRLGDVAHEHGQAARRGDDANRAVGEPGLIETLAHQGFKLLDGIVERGGGHLLDTELEQEITGVRHLGHLPLLNAIGRGRITGDLGQIGLTARLSERADAQDVRRALCGGNSAAGIQDIEAVAALHDAVIGGQRELGLEACMAFGLEIIELLAHHINVGDLEVVGGELTLVLEEDLTVGHGRAIGQIAPDQVVDARDALSVHCDALETIGDLDGNRIALDAADLLEVGELGDLHAVQPNLPTEAPGAERRALPVVLDEADVVLSRIEADGGQRIQVQLLGVLGARLNEHLELVIVLHAIGILAIAAIGGTAAGLRVARAPRLLAEAAKQRGGVERTGTHLGIVGLHNGAAMAGPILLELENHLLEGQCVRIHPAALPLIRTVKQAYILALHRADPRERPISEKDGPHDVVRGNGPEVPGIGGVLTVVPHHPQRTFWNDIRVVDRNPRSLHG